MKVFQKKMSHEALNELEVFRDMLEIFLHEYEFDVLKRDPKTGKTAETTQPSAADSPTPGRFIGEYVIVRSFDSGVHAGYMQEYDPTTRHIHLTKSRRLWKWIGFTLSEVANNGMGINDDAKISEIVRDTIIANVIEITPCSSEAKNNIENYPAHNPTK